MILGFLAVSEKVSCELNNMKQNEESKPPHIVCSNISVEPLIDILVVRILEPGSTFCCMIVCDSK
jgi:hypothetical protein